MSRSRSYRVRGKTQDIRPSSSQNFYRLISLIAFTKNIHSQTAHLLVCRKCATFSLCHAVLSAEQISGAEHHYVRAKSEQRKAGETTYRYSFPNARIVRRVTQLRILCSGMQTAPSRPLYLCYLLSSPSYFVPCHYISWKPSLS